MEELPCIFCNTSNFSVLLCQRDLNLGTGEELFNVVQCRKCRLMWLCPRPTPAEMSHYYPDHYYSLTEPRQRHGIVKQWSAGLLQGVREEFYGYPKRFTLQTPVLAQRLRHLTIYAAYLYFKLMRSDIIPYRGNGRILDVGCGAGNVMRQLQEQGWDPYGVELNPAASEHAKKHGLKVVEGELLAASYKDEFFDVVMFNHSLEHMHDPRRMLDEAHRILQPGGTLFIKIPNAGSLEASLFRKWWIGWDVPRHLFHFTPETVTRLLNLTGFHLLRIKYGMSSAYFRKSVDNLYKYVWQTKRRHGRILRHMVAGPVCRLAGLLGYGSELQVYAEKAALP